MNKVIDVRRLLEKIFSFFPFRFVMKLTSMLLASQGFGAGARISTSGEIRAVLQFLSNRVNDKLTIFDVGANRGEYCEAILSRLPNSRIYLFEPSPTVLRLLKDNIKEKDGVTFLNFGLGEKAEKRNLYKESEFARISSLTKLDVTRAAFTEQVSIRPLDQVFQELGLSAIDLLKIDVEGHELDVILGGVSTIEADPVVLETLNAYPPS